MSTYCYSATSHKYEHCWHELRLLLVNPPLREDYCCHCNDIRRVPAVHTVTTEKHGKYLNRKERT